MRIGFIGGTGHHFLQGVLGAGVVGLFTHDDFDEGAARAWREGAMPGSVWVESPAALFEMRPDVISVGGVYAKHNEFAVEALRRGIPVVSDKPTATTREQLGRLRAAVAENGGRSAIVTEYDMRSRAEFASARKAVRAGLIGDVVLATGQKSYKWGKRPGWYGDAALYGGTVLWIAAHVLDAIAYTTGLEVVPVSGVSGNVSQGDYGSCEDHTVTMVRLAGGGSGVVHADFLRPGGAPTHGDDRLRLAGTKGVLEIREGRCVLMAGGEGARDITDETAPLAAGAAMLEAVLGRDTSVYSTGHTLEMAELMLRAREVTEFRGA